MALSIISTNYNPAVNETYTITISPPSGSAFHHHVILYESSDGGQTWNSVANFLTTGSSSPRSWSTSKSSPGSFQYKAIDYYIDNTIADQSGIITVTVQGVTSTSLSLTCHPNPVIFEPVSEGVCTATATLASGGSPLSGKTIYFYVKESSPTGTTLYQTSASTDTNGNASVQLTPSLWQNSDYDPYIVAEFQGDSSHGSSSDNEQVVWYRKYATLTLSAPSSISAGVQFQLTAQLFDAEVNGKEIELWRNDVKVATATTANQGGANGIAYFYQTLQPGTYSFRAKFNGTPGGLCSDESDVVSVTAIGTGNLSLNAVPGSAQITYDWSKYEGANFNHYRLKIGTSSGSSDVANLTFSSPNSTSYTKTGLTNGVTYYATLYAEDSLDQALAQSEEITATPQATAYTELTGTGTLQKISLTRAVSGQIISASTWNTDEETIEAFTGKIFIGSVSIPAGVKDIKVKLPEGLPTSFKVFGVLESPTPCAFSIEEITSTYFKLHLASALSYSTIFHYLLWRMS